MKIKITLFVLAALFIVACEAGTKEVKFEPKVVIKEYVEATKSKDVEKLKKAASAKTIQLFEATAKAQNISLEEMLAKSEIGGMLEKPELRNEKIEGDKATVEIKNPDNDKWEELIFVKEENKWKFDVLGMLEKAKKKIDEAASKQETKSEESDKKDDSEKKEDSEKSDEKKDSEEKK